MPFKDSVRAKFVGASLLLLLIPLSGYVFVRELATYLRLGHEQVTVATAKLVAASLSDRPGLQLRRRPPLIAPPEPSAEVAPAPAADPERDRVLALFGASDASIAASLGARYVPDTAVERILNQGVARDARVWVIDANGNVRGLAGAIYAAPLQTGLESTITGAVTWLLRGRIDAVTTDAVDSREAVLAQSERALVGQSNNEWRTQSDDRFGVLSAAEPIWQGDNIVAAVVVEQSDTSQRALARRAAQSVIVVSVVVFIVAFSALVWFSYSLVRRISRLQQDANVAVDANGRATGVIRQAGGNDEISALSKTLAAMVARQAAYNEYLEKLASRLSHELRTPVAVVRSSLDNLRAANTSAGELKYLDRADEGVLRLSKLISRMAEATQLEQMLQSADVERFDLCKVVEGCIEGYRLAFAPQTIELTRPNQECMVTGLPDAMAQMLDKLMQNAVDFAAEGSTIRVQIANTAGNVILTVANTGPPLPADTSALFDSMISIREDAQGGEHLGLGLHIARLIAEFHDGKISAANLHDGSGVVIEIVMPLVPQDKLKGN
ncbi:MAG: ATP-binding protein [Burkholderiales bacterium]|nr:ATP-binding protein [Betaproteobacteria bacterium]